MLRALGREVTAKEHKEIMKRFSIFKTWFVNQYMKEGARFNIIALHLDTMKAKYRDEYPGNSNPNTPGLRAPYLSAIMESPELAVPSKSFSSSPVYHFSCHPMLRLLAAVTQLSYQSRITGREEKLPMVVSLMGAPGTDMELIQCPLDALRKSHRPTVVQTGKLAFHQTPE